MQTKFPDYSKAEWLAKVEKDLKGKPIEGLNWEIEGETFSPFWHRDDMSEPPLKISHITICKIGVSIPFSDYASSNKLALEALRGGANFLRFDYPGSMSEADKAILLDGILLEIIDCEFFDQQRGGKSTYSQADIADYLKVQATTPWENPRIWLRIDNDYFKSIAFIRAVRLCIQQINHAHNLSSSCEIGVIVSPDKDCPADFQRISSTSKAMSAIIGGADILLIEPMDTKRGSTFERRIARNIQHLLHEESHLGTVADPAAGSYYIENLTNTVAEKIWAAFQQISKHD